MNTNCKMPSILIQCFKTLRFLPQLSCILIVQFFCISAIGQDNSNYTKAKTKLLKTLRAKNYEKAFAQNIEYFYKTTCDSLIKKKYKVDNKPIKDILTKLFEVSSTKITKKTIDILRIPSLNYDFLLTLKTYKKSSLLNLIMGINVTKTNVLQAVFEGSLLGDSIKILSGLKEMFYEPYFISSRIQLPQYSVYKDTLIYLLANGAPDILVKKLAANDTVYTTLVNKSKSKTVKAVSNIKLKDNFEKIVPFSLSILENSVTEEEIMKLTANPKAYFHAFASEAIRLYLSKDPQIHTFLRQPLIDINKKNANHYYIKIINDLHESPDKIRFESLDGLPPIDLYFILLAGKNELVLGGSSELYTSSFIYLYKKFLKEAEKEGIDKFFESIDYYQFDLFLSNLSDYGLVNNLVDNLKEEKAAELMVKYLSGLPNKQLTDNEIILNAMTMAEVFYQIKDCEVIRNTLVENLQKISSKPIAQNFFMYQRMYQGLKDILLDKNEFNSDDIYDVLLVKKLQRDNKIVQICFFYDDEDGISSFANSIAVYNNKLWDKKDEENYVVYTSKSGNSMKVFMNKPNTKLGSDSSQNIMLKDISTAGYDVASFIHRGHSYHLDESLRKFTTSAQFVFLGSCGGYSQVLKVFNLNPDVNIISTRSVGSKLINDPLLERINIDLVNNKDIYWNTLWKEFDVKFQSKTTKDLFSAYMAPNKYIGIKFIRKVFNY